MTTEERVIAALNYEEPDRVPVWTIIDNANVYRHFAPERFNFSKIRESRGELPSDFLELAGEIFNALGIDVTFAWGGMNPFPYEEFPGKTKWANPHPYRTISDLAHYTPEIPSYESIVNRYVKSFRELEQVMKHHTVLIIQGGCSLELGYNHIGIELFCIALYEAPREIG